ncbi:MAG: universal stress protein [Acidimicrobiales bacterium]
MATTNGKHRILVALDQSEGSDRVAAFVNRFFGDLDVEILAINVGHAATPMVTYGWADPMPYVDPRLLDPQLDEAAAHRAETDAEAVLQQSPLQDDEAIVELGDPADTILRAAEEHGADVIVIGSSDRGVLSRLLTPSVSKKVLEHADRPVLLVH